MLFGTTNKEEKLGEYHTYSEILATRCGMSRRKITFCK
jgi:hypothetical protein